MHPDRSFSSEPDRKSALISRFSSAFARPPDFLVRAPGRVNLIGEHIDYHGYSVLPMALTQDILMAVGRNEEGMLRMKNVDANNYADFECGVGEMEIARGKPMWHDYVLCGIKGIFEQKKNGDAPLGEYSTEVDRIW